jgi:hypothetical protein
MQRLQSLMGLGSAPSAAERARWNAMAQNCKQFANEGACLSRLARRGIPITIESAWETAGLGRDCSQFANAGACYSRAARDGRAITVQGPFGGLGQLTGRALLGPDRSRQARGAVTVVDGDWAQKGANAALQANGPGGGRNRIVVDGNVGPLTLTQLAISSRQYAGGGAVTGTPAGIGGRVTMPTQLEQRLASLPEAPNPAVPTGRTSTTVARSTTASPSTGKLPGAADAPPDASGTVGLGPDGMPTLVEGGGMPTWLVPALVVGGVAVAGSIGIVMWGRSRRAPAPVRSASSAMRSGASAVMANLGGRRRARRTR